MPRWITSYQIIYLCDRFYLTNYCYCYDSKLILDWNIIIETHDSLRIIIDCLICQRIYESILIQTCTIKEMSPIVNYKSTIHTKLKWLKQLAVDVILTIAPNLCSSLKLNPNNPSTILEHTKFPKLFSWLCNWSFILSWTSHHNSSIS